MLGITDLRRIADIEKRGLRTCQYEAITELEKSFRSGQDQQMALALGPVRHIQLVSQHTACSTTPDEACAASVDRNKS